jgi:hypothetical protein
MHINRKPHNVGIGIISLLVIQWLVTGCTLPRPENAIQLSRTLRIFPDYTDLVIPPNIAPLNFKILESGERFFVNIHTEHGTEIHITGNGSNVEIPIKPWKSLLSSNRGGDLTMDVFVEQNGQWQQFQPITNRIAGEDIDSHLMYRLIEPQFTYWHEMGLYQRNLENFNETCVLSNSVTGNNCMNCHNFYRNSPDKMLFHIRVGATAGTYLWMDGRLRKIDTSTDFNKAGAYPSWHPNGTMIAFSVNKLSQFFHSTGEIRDVLDWASDLICYDIPSNTVKTFPSIASPDRLETFPAWAADGRSLFFCSAPKFDAFVTKEENLLYKNIKYDLMRIEYDPDNGTWGALQTLISAKETNRSVTMPRPSPDGRYLLFCMAEYGNFPIFRPDCDLYLMDLQTGAYTRPEVNSDQADTFHSWSSNSRWFVFSSKRLDGLRARPFLCYVDEAGNTHKPFIMPQKDPDFYHTFIKTYNVPELTNGPVQFRWLDIVKIAYDQNRVIKAKLDPKVQINQTTGATPDSDEMYRQGSKK